MYIDNMPEALPSSPSIQPIETLDLVAKIQDFFAQQILVLALDRKRLMEFIVLVAQKIQMHPEIFAAKFGEFT